VYTVDEVLKVAFTAFAVGVIVASIYYTIKFSWQIRRMSKQIKEIKEQNKQIMEDNEIRHVP
jgi:uncharacterized membrane protein YciS (DUF1049 family)